MLFLCLSSCSILTQSHASTTLTAHTVLLLLLLLWLSLVVAVALLLLLLFSFSLLIGVFNDDFCYCIARYTLLLLKKSLFFCVLCLTFRWRVIISDGFAFIESVFFSPSLSGEKNIVSFFIWIGNELTFLLWHGTHELAENRHLRNPMVNNKESTQETIAVI